MFRPWKEINLDIADHYLLRESMVTHLPCMPSRDPYTSRLKGFVLKLRITKAFLSWLVASKHLMILECSDGNNFGEIYVGSIIKTRNLYNVGIRKAILNINLIEGVDSILYLMFLECSNYPKKQRLYFLKGFMLPLAHHRSSCLCVVLSIFETFLRTFKYFFLHTNLWIRLIYFSILIEVGHYRVNEPWLGINLELVYNSNKVENFQSDAIIFGVFAILNKLVHPNSL